MNPTLSTLKNRIGEQSEPRPKEGSLSALRNRVGAGSEPAPKSGSDSGNGALSALRNRIGKSLDQDEPAAAASVGKRSTAGGSGLVASALAAVRDRLAGSADSNVATPTATPLALPADVPSANAPSAEAPPSDVSLHEVSPPAASPPKVSPPEASPPKVPRAEAPSVRTPPVKELDPNPIPARERTGPGPGPLSAAPSPISSLLADITGAVRRHAKGRRPRSPRSPRFPKWSKWQDDLHRPDWLRRKQPKLICGSTRPHVPPRGEPTAAGEPAGDLRLASQGSPRPPAEPRRKPTPDETAEPAPVPRRPVVSADAGLGRVLRPWRMLGWGIVVVFIVGSAVWAANTRLDAAAIAHGTVAVETSRKTIQHLEGGIIKEILVSEGDRVEAGQVLVKFDDTYTQGNLDMLNGRYVAALALQARLIAERDGAKEIDFPDELLKRAHDPKVSEVITGEIDIFKSRGGRLDNQESILRQRIEKHRREIAGLTSQVTAGRRQLALLEEEIASLEDLFKKGVVSKTRLLAMQRQSAAISGEVGDHLAMIARAEKSINEVRLQLTTPRAQHLNQVTEQLQRVQGEIADLREKVHAAKDVGRRTSVTAPQAGRVVALQVHTAGGVVQPGQALMDLVPEEDRLVIDVRVDPGDIDAVYAGMTARVRLTAFSARTTPMLDGLVTSVSADRVSDPVTGESYFTARVVPDDGAQAFDLSELKAGMQAEVFLVTAERTALDYMVEPLVRSFSRAGREQ